MLGKSFDLPAPSTTISPSVLSTLPIIPIFCISAEPVGFVCVKAPSFPTYTLSPAINPLVLNPINLPLTTALPAAVAFISA